MITKYRVRIKDEIGWASRVVAARNEDVAIERACQAMKVSRSAVQSVEQLK